MSVWYGLWLGWADRGRRGAVAVVAVLLLGLAVMAWPAAGTALAVPHLYWGNRVVFTIGRANLDGTGVNQSFIAAGNGPQGLAVDGQHIYWAIIDGNTIGEANLDGTGVNQSFITGVDDPGGVAVNGQHIYWTNIGDGTIGEANLNGTGVNESLISGANRRAPRGWRLISSTSTGPISSATRSGRRT